MKTLEKPSLFSTVPSSAALMRHSPSSFCSKLNGRVVVAGSSCQVAAGSIDVGGRREGVVSDVVGGAGLRPVAGADLGDRVGRPALANVLAEKLARDRVVVLRARRCLNEAGENRRLIGTGLRSAGQEAEVEFGFLVVDRGRPPAPDRSSGCRRSPRAASPSITTSSCDRAPPHCCASSSGGWSSGGSSSGEPLSTAPAHARKREPEARALARRRPHLEPAAVQRGVLERDREAESGAARGALARRVGAPEAVEDALDALGSHADAVIAHGDRHGILVAVDVDDDRLALAVVDGVAEQVLQDATDATGVDLGLEVAAGATSRSSEPFASASGSTDSIASSTRRTRLVGSISMSTAPAS